MRTTLGLGAAWRIGAAMAIGALVSCGENPLETYRETQPPTVDILEPTAGQVFPVGAPLGVRVRVQDNRAVAAVRAEAFGVRRTGSAVQFVPKYAPQEVRLGTARRTVRDTTLAFVLTTNDTIAEEVAVVVAVSDSASTPNVGSDTVFVAVSRPRVAITAPTAGATVLGGRALAVTVRAADPLAGLSELTLQVRGLVETSLAVPLPTSGDSTGVTLTLPEAPGQAELRLWAEAISRNGVRRVSDTVRVVVRDGVAPVVDLQAPSGGFRVPVGDSVLVRARVLDRGGVAQVTFTGFALRGDPRLGTQTRVERFAAQTVTLPSSPVVLDTVVARFLRATTDTTPESTVYLVATAQDVAGNLGADTVVVSIGGPRVEIRSPSDGATVEAGTVLGVRVAASDAARKIAAVELRTAGAVTTTVRVTTNLRDAIDTTLTVAVPNPAAADTLRLMAVAYSGAGDSATARPVTVRVIAPQPDRQPPTVTFQANAPLRSELGDTLTVSVGATDNRTVTQVGATVVAIYRGAGRDDTLGVRMQRVAGASGAFRFALADFNRSRLETLLRAQDSLTLSLEITAHAVDDSGNCGAAVVRGTAQSLACVTRPSGEIVAGQAGARLETQLARGATLRAGSGDRFLDLASDGARLFVSNQLRNRVDVFDVVTNTRTGAIAVGSEPWGLALSPDLGTLFVANSGGTNFSVVSTATLLETRRIATPNLRVYGVTYQVADVVVPVSATRSDTLRNQLVPTAVTVRDYSDRPQYLGQLATGSVLYSTKPTRNAPDGTLRRLDPTTGEVRLVWEYARDATAFEGIVLDADSAFFLPQGREVLPGKNRGPEIIVYPRGCSDGARAAVGFVNEVQDSLVRRACRTRLWTGVRLDRIGLTDTTYVAVSGDHQRIAFGEGNRPAEARPRILLLRESGGVLVQSGDIEDLTNNAAERVVGLALNRDGSLGLARGQQAYAFDSNLRLQGVLTTGTPSGGVAFDPRPGSNRAFVSGVDAAGRPYIDVVELQNFQTLRRLFLREPVVGALVAVAPVGAPPDVVLKLFALTPSGVVTVDLYASDLP